MSGTPVIQTENLGKLYRIGERAPYETLRDAIANAVASRFRRPKGTPHGLPNADPNPGSNGYIWALRNVSLEVREGEAVGIIGPNGAGKSTLLKVLSRITEPTEGSARLHGRVSSLLEVGTGFHHELTGRENLYLNGAILGMRKSEIDRKFDEIVDFSEIREFIDTPVKRYSDGMRVRLGFAIAAHLEPEILLVDEVLAVGDASFQRKCLGKMGEVTGEGRTILFVSHDMAAIQNLCGRAYALNHGRVFASGEVDDVISKYLESVSRPPTISIADRTDRKGSGKVRVVGFSISGAVNSHDTVQCGSPATFRIAYRGTPPLRNVAVEILFYNRVGTCVLMTGNSYVGRDFDEAPGRGTFLCHFDKFPLSPGVYHLRFWCGVNGVDADDIRNALALHVIEGDFYGSGKLPPRNISIFAVPHEWDLEAAVDISQEQTTD